MPEIDEPEAVNAPHGSARDCASFDWERLPTGVEVDWAREIDEGVVLRLAPEVTPGRLLFFAVMLSALSAVAYAGLSAVDSRWMLAVLYGGCVAVAALVVKSIFGWTELCAGTSELWAEGSAAVGLMRTRRVPFEQIDVVALNGTSVEVALRDGAKVVLARGLRADHGPVFVAAVKRLAETVPVQEKTPEPARPRRDFGELDCCTGVSKAGNHPDGFQITWHQSDGYREFRTSESFTIEAQQSLTPAELASFRMINALLFFPAMFVVPALAHWSFALPIALLSLISIALLVDEMNWRRQLVRIELRAGGLWCEGSKRSLFRRFHPEKIDINDVESVAISGQHRRTVTLQLGSEKSIRFVELSSSEYSELVADAICQCLSES